MSLQQGNYEFSKKLLRLWNRSLNVKGLIYILTRSDSILPKDHVRLDDNTIYIPHLGINRTHFSKNPLKAIFPKNWRIDEMNALIYQGSISKISALEVIALKSS